jgi:hypothetical protein
VTNAALQSPHIEKEVLQAKRENKRSIPCIYENVRDSEIKWGLNEIKGIKFSDKYELVRELYATIPRASNKT